MRTGVAEPVLVSPADAPHARSWSARRRSSCTISSFPCPTPRQESPQPAQRWSTRAWSRGASRAGWRATRGGGRGALEAAGLEHSNPSDVVELCGWLFDDGRVQVAPHGKFWGSLAEDDALAETLALAVSAAEQAFPDAPALVAITRPPETVLLLSDRRAGTVGVLDTHSRAAGIAQHPSAFYRCRSLDAAAQLLRFIFFPLPEEMEPEVTPFPLPLPPPPPPLPSSCPPPTPAEASSARAAQELGLYSLFELTVFCVAAPRAGERGGSTPDAGGGETRAGSGGADKPGERDGAGAGAPHAAP